MHEGEIDSDMESWLHLTASDDDRRFRFLNQLIENKHILDFGCGHGGFLIRAKKTASRVAGIEIEGRLKNYFEDKGLKNFPSIEKVSGVFDVITLFHVLEHIPDPKSILAELSEMLADGG